MQNAALFGRPPTDGAGKISVKHGGNVVAAYCRHVASLL